LILLLACTDDVDPCPGGELIGQAPGCRARVKLEGTLGSLPAELRWPETGGDEAPVAVFVPGSFQASVVPVGAGTPQADLSQPVVTVHVDLAGDAWAEGLDDRRGAMAREAVAMALRYAACEAEDSEGLCPADRVGSRRDITMLVGHSNGGNLAVATLADPSLDLPAVAGLVSFETPAGASFVNVEHGANGTAYREGSCALGDGGIDCPFTTTEAALDAEGEKACADLDGDGTCAPPEATAGGSADPVTGLHALSPRLRTMLDDSGVDALGFDSVDDARDYWAERDAAQLVPAMALEHPVPAILIATEEDHVLEGLHDHPHVYGLYERLRAAGLWVRLNPGADWTAFEEENEPGAAFGLSNPAGWLTPEEGGESMQGLFAAALRELTDRTDGDSW